MTNDKNDGIESPVARNIMETGVDSSTGDNELLWSDHSNKYTGVTACKKVGKTAKAFEAGFRLIKDRGFYSDTFEFGD